MNKTKYAALNSVGDKHFQTYPGIERGVLGIIIGFLGDAQLRHPETIAVVKFGGRCIQISVKYLDFYELSSPVTPEERRMVEMLGYIICGVAE